MQDFLLQENGSRLLQEDGDKIFLEQQTTSMFTQPGANSINLSS